VKFGFDGSKKLVIDVSICCDHIGNSTVNNRHLTARFKPMNISRNILGSKTGSTKLIVLLLVQRLHLQSCQWLAKFIPSFIFCGSWLANRCAITMRSLALRRRLTASLSRGVELACLLRFKQEIYWQGHRFCHYVIDCCFYYVKQ